MTCVFEPRRRRRLWLALWLACGTATAAADQPLLGRVVSLAPDRVLVELSENGGAAPRQLELPLDSAGAPAGVAVGDWVRLWPGEASPEPAAAAGYRLSPAAGGARGMDRTGVRSRLMRAGGGRRGGGRGGR